MRIITGKTLIEETRQQTGLHNKIANLLIIFKACRWTSFEEIKKSCPTVDRVRIGEKNYLIFNVGQFRLIMGVVYASKHTQGVLFYKDWLSHTEYEKNHWKKKLG